MKKILVLTPLDRESLNVLLSKMQEELKQFPVEVQSPALLAEVIYKQMQKNGEKENSKSFFHCYLSALQSYEKLTLNKESVFLLDAPLKIMLGGSTKETVYHEVWSYNFNIASTQEEYAQYYMEKFGEDIEKYMKLYKSTEATRRFTSFKGLINALLKELSKEIKANV